MLLENMSLGFAAGFLALLVASAVDIRTREVPDWISYSLITFAIGYSAILSAYHSTWGFLVNALAGFAIGAAIGLLMFYTGQWGGGDSKLIMGVSALFGFSIPGMSQIYGNYELFIFLANTILVGAVYGLLFSTYKATTNFGACKIEARKKLGQRKMAYVRTAIIIILAAGLAYHVLSYTLESMLVFAFAILVAVLFYVSVFLSCVENVCMIKEIEVGKLTEGDWLANDAEKNGKAVVKASKIGLTLEEIAKLRKSSIKKVVVKEGIPFVPSFLIAYILTFLLQNWIMTLF